MARCIYRASEINRVEFWRKARWLRGLSRVIFGLLGDFRAGTLRNSMFRKSPEQNPFRKHVACKKLMPPTSVAVISLYMCYDRHGSDIYFHLFSQEKRLVK